MSSFTDKAIAELTRDWKRTGILAVLLVAGAVLAIRQFSGSQTSQAKATDLRPAGKKDAAGKDLVKPGDARNSDAPAALPGVQPGDASRAGASAQGHKVFRFAADVSMLNTPRRDPFVADLDAFAPDPAMQPKPKNDVKVSQPGGPGGEEVSRQQQLAQEANIKAEAQKLQLASVLMGSTPRAMIGKDIFQVGQQVGPFLLTRITANSVTLEKDGFEVVLRLEGR